MRVKAGLPHLVPFQYLIEGEYRSLFEKASLSDLRWMIRKMAGFTPTQLQKIFRESGYPFDVSELLAAKLMDRLENLTIAFDVRDKSGQPLYPLPHKKSLEVNSPGRIEAGQRVHPRGRP